MTQITSVTPKAVFDTVVYDSQVHLWFKKFCFLPAVVKKLTDVSPDTVKVYRAYRYLSLVSFGSGALALVLCAAAYFLTGLIFFLVNAWAGCALVVSWACFARRRRCLATLAARLIEGDLPSLPAGVTLYQLAEIYSRQYHLPSLVDVIWQWNTWMRNTVILVYFAAFGVWFLSFPLMLFWTATGCFGVLCLLQAVFFLRRSRSVQ